MNPKRLAFLIVSLSYAGAQTQMLALARTLKARGWDIKVITMMKPEGQTIMPMLEELNIPWVSLDVTRGSSNPLSPIIKLREILNEWHPTILHSHMIHANILARLTRLFTRIPVLICTAHSLIEGGRLREFVYRLTDPWCDYTTNVSQAAVNRYIEVGIAPKRKIGLIPNGIDTQGFRPEPESRIKLRTSLGLEHEFAWLAIGRLDDPKDYAGMIRGFHLLKGKPRLFIVGEGPHLASLETLVSELELNERVTFLGIRKDIPDLMSAMDGYVMSSRFEGMPMVLLEAAAVGLPIVATDVGGNREIVLDHKNGFLVPPGDPKKLSESMEKLMHTKVKERDIMGKLGQRHVQETYDLHHIVDLWEKLYTDYMQRKGIKIMA